MKSDKITACIIGRKINILQDGLNSPDYVEKNINIINVDNDHLYADIVKKWNPNVFVTFGNWEDQKFLCVAPPFIKEKWINLPTNSSLNDIGMSIYNCYANNTYSNTKSPLVSVFTSAYKPNEKIFRPLQSLLDQSYKNWEWVIVDDSDDNSQTWNLLKELSELDFRIKPFKPSRHSGVIGELKRWACGLCSGEFLCELDHDDELTTDCLSWVVDAFINNTDVGMVYTDNAEVFDDTLENYTYSEGWGFGYGSYRSEIYKNKEYMVSNEIPINETTLQHIVGVPNHVRAWRKSTYFNLGGHNVNLHVADDYDLIIKTFLYSKMLRIPKFGYIQYRNRTGNTTFSRNGEIQRIVNLVITKYKQEIKDKISSIIV